MCKILVSYFSATGATKRTAEDIAELVKGDLFEIDPVYKYTAEDLKWPSNTSRARKEIDSKTFRPPVTKRIDDPDKYDKIVLGFPVWWNQAPNIVHTFLEQNNLVGKRVYVFVTSGAQGYEKSYKSLKKQYPYIDFMGGIRINGSFMKKDVLDWLQENA